MTRADDLHAVTKLKNANIERAREAFDAYAEDVDSYKDLLDALKEADLDDISGQLIALADALRPIVEMGMFDQDALDDLDTTAGWMGSGFNGTLDDVSIQAFTEAYDNLSQALDSYEDLKEQEPYAGKRDDLEAAWNDAVNEMTAVADAADDLQLDKEEE